MHIFIALLIYIGIVGTSNIHSYWKKGRLTIHKPMEYITFFRFEQIKQYFHVSPSPTSTSLFIASWHTKLSPLSDLLRTKFKAYVVLSQNISFDEMMVPFAGRSKHMLKMKNKPIKEGFKIWALCNHGYLWDFLFYSCTCGKL
jgi:Transposase IS4